MEKTIVVASGNENKIEEIKKIFQELEFVSMHSLGFNEDIEENGQSFKENATIKAKAVSKALKRWVISDDSGLCVDALGGAPGIYSSRYSGRGGEENRKLLLRNLEGVQNRRAHFCCCVCLCSPIGECTYGFGKTYGHILFKETGSMGFGYDCLFFSDDLQKPFGLVTADEKNSVSHRGRALYDLKDKLKAEGLI